MTLEENKVAVADAVFTHYVETGTAADVCQLALRLGWSESKVRRVIREGGGAVVGTVAQREDGLVGTAKFWAWLPALWRMRQELLTSRSAE
jgi:hypothetical protein